MAALRKIDVADFSSARELVEVAKQGPLVLHGDDGRVFAVCEVEEADYEAWSLGNNPDFLAMLGRAREEADREGWLTTEEVRHQLGLDATP